MIFPQDPYCYLPFLLPFLSVFPSHQPPKLPSPLFFPSPLCSICVLKFLFLLSMNNFLQPVFELTGSFFSLKESSLKIAIMSSTSLTVFFSSRNCLVSPPCLFI